MYTNKYKDNGREKQYLGIGFRAIMSQLMNDKNIDSQSESII